MSGLAAHLAARLRVHPSNVFKLYRRQTGAPALTVDPKDARTRWSQYRPQKFEELRFPLTEADNDADYWRARCELAEEDADRLYAFTNPAHAHISPAVVEWVRNQHVDALHYRTAARDRLVPQ